MSCLAALSAGTPRFASRSPAPWKAITNPLFGLVDCIRGVDDPANVVGKGEERYHGLPVATPGHGDGRVFLPPIAGIERLQRRHSGIGILGPVDGLQLGGDGPAVLVADEIQ